ncbi:Cation/calcium exchanger 4 [Auxenochlorella protothecoides]|uniref:Cation/calcium exchanger 4 n=1 Tax=Auxenochlorella protothecoides TaxID=3075 RepID=A0A087SNT9_AUXPR|nr:Cation/calcium exchanger 4 [Auxenochlorella protothecoides]KFM27393.1 Cation/calcium exchanger 4 [Auxenochlorella protothecoides]
MEAILHVLFSSTAGLRQPIRVEYWHAACPRLLQVVGVTVGLSRSDAILPASEDSKCQSVRDLPADQDRCAYAETYCETDSLFDYTKAYYCHVYPTPWKQGLMITACVLLLLTLFRVMALAADEFFSVILSQISQDLGLPPRLAGVTLLALGNGAPDLSASVAAVKSGNVELALGALTGASMFVTCIVAGRVIRICGGVSARGAQIRDIAFFAAALVLIAIVVGSGRVNAGAVAALLLLYFTYVAVVALADISKRAGVAWTRLLDPRVMHAPPLAAFEVRGRYRDLLEMSAGSELESVSGASTPRVYEFKLDRMERGGGEGNGEGAGDEWRAPVDRATRAWSAIQPRLALCLWALERPFVLALRASVPLVEKDAYRRGWFVLSALLAPSALNLALQRFDAASLAAAAGAGAALAAAAGVLTHPGVLASRPPDWALGTGYPLGALLVALAGFAVAALWINLAANELVGLLQFFGVLSGVQPAVLGVTVLAWGNSLADLVTNASLARRGAHGTSMAMTACFAGPIALALVGVALARARRLPRWVGGALMAWYAAYLAAVLALVLTVQE